MKKIRVRAKQIHQDSLSLNLGGKLLQKEYENLMALKTKRNDIIHQGETATFEETEKSGRAVRDRLLRHESAMRKDLKSIKIHQAGMI